ncbi:GNAT family N-acetyltransferase [Chthonobacter rhizosphaerae]|uniref:GNAT family N-acetyltransferase n=1 Tax=Chthonobacter rhizosphaerae TaxID=2735553 RepID=UPI0015EE6E44|nr:GNAT family N-acetyltransferase [Chthonobacter rhizosphaerae]
MAKASGTAPVIETARLRLRPHAVADFDAMHRLWTDPEVVRFIGGRPSTSEEVWGRLLRYAGLWRLLGYGYWAVEERLTGGFVGDVGLADFRRTIEPPLTGAPEIGWVMDPAVHGRGFATEAVRAVLSWRDKALPPGRTVCLIAPENGPSLKVAAKTGFRPFAETLYHGAPTTLFKR